MEVSRSSLVSRYSNKTSEELFELHQSGGLTDMAYDVIEGVMSERGMEIPARPDQYKNIRKDGQIKRYWGGKESLSSSFWVIGILGSFIVIILSAAISTFFMLLTVNAFDALPDLPAALTFSWITTPYIVLTTVAIWRSSKKSKYGLLKFIILYSIYLITIFPIYAIVHSKL